MPMAQTTARRTATALIRSLPQRTLPIVVDFLTYLQTKDEWDATLEILKSPALLQSRKRGRGNLRQGRWVRWHDVKRRV